MENLMVFLEEALEADSYEDFKTLLLWRIALQKKTNYEQCQEDAIISAEELNS